MREEIPPTAGLPLGWRDLLPGSGAGFPAALQAFTGAPHLGLTCSGTAALVCILHALRGRSGRRKVIVPAYTCPLVVMAIARAGLQAMPCDVAAGSFELDANDLQALCDAQTLAVVPAHLAGRVHALAEVAQIARRHGAFLIEDAAQALGAHTGDRSVGLGGEAGFFSLAAGKGLSLFEGGFWVCRDPLLAEDIRAAAAALAPRRPLLEWQRCLQLLGYALFYRPQLLDLVHGRGVRAALARRDMIAACADDFSPRIALHAVGAWRQAVGLRALPRLQAFQARLHDQALARLPQLQALPGVQILQDGPAACGTWPSFLMLCPDAAAADRVLQAWWGAGAGVSRMFAHALTDYDYLRPWLPWRATPGARDLAARLVVVSNSHWLDDSRFERLHAGLREALLRAG